MASKKESEAPAGPLTFEERFQRLKEITDQLGDGEMPLDQMEAQFKEGIDLYQQCAEELDRVEMSVQTLLKDAEERFQTEPFQTDEEEPE